MTRRGKVSFLAKKKIKKRVSFEARPSGRKISFIVRAASKRKTKE